METTIPGLQAAAVAGLCVAAFAMLVITQTKERVKWPGWLVPALAFIPMTALTVLAIVDQGLAAVWLLYTDSLWGLQMWFERLASVTVAFFLLQNRARASGLKSEAWVLLVILTGGLGLLVMLAHTVFLERKHSKS